MCYPRRSILSFVVLAFALQGCAQGLNNTAGGALGGSALGAGLGAIVGNQAGNPGAGIAIGAAAGALGGALIGNSLDSQAEERRKAEVQVSRNQEQIEENRRILDELRARGADAYSTNRGIVVNLPDVLFEFNRAQLTSDAEVTVGEITNVLRKTGRSISVEGHADAVGSENYNYRLSERRAETVANELTRGGIPSRAIRVHGYGESQPIASNDTERGRARNRRVEVVLEN